MRETTAKNTRANRFGLLSALLLTTVAAAPFSAPRLVPVQAPAPIPCPEPVAQPAVVSDVEVTGQVLYGSASGAKKAAVVEIVEVYKANPAYMSLKAKGLSETSGRGKELFEEARNSTNKALASVARRHGVDVITVPGGVTSSEDVADLTREVVDQLPLFSLEGELLHGSNPQAMKSAGEVSSQEVLDAIPDYLEWKGLDETDARYHLLKKSYRDQFAKAIKKVARDQGLDGIAERGDLTSRLGQVPDVTRAAIEALGQ